MAPIHDAARDGDVEALQRELGRGVSPDARGGTGDYTPLFLSVTNDRPDCVRILLQAGADPNAQVLNNKATALHVAAVVANSESRDCIRMLLEAGAAVNARTTVYGWTAMDYSYYERDARVYPLLLRAGSELPQEKAGRPLREDPYLGRIISAGGFKAYERAHREALTRTLSPKFALPPELVRTVVEFYLHAGFYPFTPAA